MDLYILTGKTFIQEPDPVKWGEWFATADRKILKTKVGKVDVSTVFLGLDHSFGTGRPVLFETMIFGGKHDQYCTRDSSYAAAIISHKHAVKMISKKGKVKK